MMKQFPTTNIPNTQAFPANAYPASAFYGINSTLADMSSMSASGSATNPGGSSASLSPAQSNPRGLIVAFLIVIGVIVLWHLYNK